MNTLGTLLAVALFLMLAQAAYLFLFRPVVLFALQRRIIALRDDLRVSALSGKIPAGDQGFRILDLDLQRKSAEEFNVTVTMLLFFKLDLSQGIQAQEDRHTIETSDPIIRKIWSESNMITLAAALINSPAWWFVLPFILVLAPLSGNVKEIVERIFWNGTNGNGMAGAGGACPAT